MQITPLPPTKQSVIEQVDDTIDRFLRYHHVVDADDCSSCSQCQDGLDVIEALLDDLSGVLADIECAHVIGRHDLAEVPA